MFEFGKYFNKQVTHDSNSEINKLTNHIKTKIGKWQVLHSPSKNFLWIKNAKVAGTSMYRGVLEKEIHDILSYKKNPEEFDKWWDSLTDEKIKEYAGAVKIEGTIDKKDPRGLKGLTAVEQVMLLNELSHEKRVSDLKDFFV